jgi:hypothetical protein
MLAACGPVRRSSPLGPMVDGSLPLRTAGQETSGTKLRCRLSATLFDRCVPAGAELTLGKTADGTARRAGFILPAAPGRPAGEGERSFRALSVRRSLTPQTALALSAGSGPRSDTPDVRIVLGFQYSF